MDQVKEAFQKVKEDIQNLRGEIDFLKSSLSEIKDFIKEFKPILENIDFKKSNYSSTQTNLSQTDRHIISTQNEPLEGLKHQNLPISIGNEGVSTDRQTDTSTDRQTHNSPKDSSLNNALNVLDSLDNLKKEIRIKFKKITEQETLVFSTIYQLEEEIGYANYKIISEKLNLTESSVRDHVGSLIKKGIPLEKKKVNNKQISLFVSQNLKKIAPLSTILMLRGL